MKRTQVLIREISAKSFTIIKNGNNQDHERREVKFPDQCNEHEAKLQSRGKRE